MLKNSGDILYTWLSANTISTVSLFPLKCAIGKDNIASFVSMATETHRYSVPGGPQWLGHNSKPHLLYFLHRLRFHVLSTYAHHNNQIKMKHFLMFLLYTLTLYRIYVMVQGFCWSFAQNLKWTLCNRFQLRSIQSFSQSLGFIHITDMDPVFFNQ